MPLSFDLPLEKCQHYMGRNPRPADFDAYWDRALQEMHSLDPQVEMRPTAFKAPGAECFNMYFTGVGGARVHAKLLRPKTSSGSQPALLLFHGYSGNSGDWNDKLGWVAAGFTVAALDCRGQGGLSEDSGSVKGMTFKGHFLRGLGDHPDRLLYRSMYLDTAQLARIVMGLPGVDAGRVAAMGGSQGGGLTLACASLEPRIKRAVPIYPFLCDYKRTWEMDQAKGAYEELSYYFRNFDPQHEHEDELFTKLGYVDVQFLCPRIKAEILMATSLMDTICPPSTQFAAYNKITSKKRMELYPDFGHESLPGMGDKAFAFLTAM